MNFQHIKYKTINWLNYLKEYAHNVFFKLVLLFVLNFIMFGLYFKNFFKVNFIIFLIFLVINLYIIRKLLYKRARPTKILVILIILGLSFFTAQNYSAFVFENFGLNSFISSFSGELSDTLFLSGTKNMLKDTVQSGKQVIDTTKGTITHSKEDSQKTFAHINQLRQENGVKTILWDDKIYNLAKWKTEDMTKRRYFDHVDPDKKCVGSYARNFELNYPSDSFAENIFGYSSSTWFNQDEAVTSWMTSRGHRYNLLYPDHIRGAIACDSKNCVFIGQGGSGWACNTGEEGLTFWDSVGKQPGER
ncbi:MAG: CAP domain-containing protein [Candidatus Woesearchaeota archaeon]